MGNSEDFRKFHEILKIDRDFFKHISFKVITTHYKNNKIPIIYVSLYHWFLNVSRRILQIFFKKFCEFQPWARKL